MNESTANSSNGLITFSGALLVAASLAAGAWYGLKQSGNPIAQQVGKDVAPTAPSTASGGGKVSSSNSNDGEIIVKQPRYIRPPELYDTLAAMAASSTKAVTATPASAKTIATAQAAVVPAGWAGTGNPIQRMWEGNSAGRWEIRATPLSPKNWRISGVVQRGAQTQVIVQFDEEPTPKFYKIGDTLPGGAKLAWVKPDVIGVIESKSGGLAVPILDGQTQAQAPAAAANPKASAKP
jgi:hypothetical protein